MSDHPPLQGTPRVLLESFLDSYRRGVVATLRSLTDAQAAERVLPATDLTAAGIVVHLARVEDLWFSETFAGEATREPWASAPYADDRDWEFHAGGELGIDGAVELYDAACERSRRVAAGVGSLDDVAAVPSFGVGPVSLGWVFVHLLEETAHHTGHLDLLRDALVQASVDAPGS